MAKSPDNNATTLLAFRDCNVMELVLLVMG